ncbi:MAG: discoidin domain-containing protein [Kiritimatiellae bacterium]|nr:discoidin domain-containing protein [Kiritimatiellia bacterium]
MKKLALVPVLCAVMVSTPSFADTTIANNLTLNADTDWRADGVVTVPANVTVDLNGYTLWVSGLAGAGTFTSSVPDPDPTTFDLTTAQTDASRVKSYQGGTDQALGTEFTFSSQPAWKAFADYAAYDSTHRTITAFTNGESDPVDIVYEFDSAIPVNSYKIQVTSANSYLKRSPRSWKFFGSVTGADNTWVELDSQTNVTDWANYELRQFTFFNDTAYKFYRLRISQANGSDNVLEFFKLEYGRVQNQIRIDLSQTAGFADATIPATGTAKYVVIGGMASANADLRGLGKVTLEGTLDLNGCVVRAAALDGKGKVTSTFSDSAAFDLTTTQTDDTYVKSYFGDSTEPQAFNTDPAWKAFADYANYTSSGDNRQRVIDTTENYPKHIVYDFQTPTFVDTYKLMLGSKDSAPKRAPKTIAFSGSNDGTTWTTLDSRSSETGWSASQERTYSFPSERAYRYYRISFSANNENGSIIEFFRLQYGRQNRNKFIVDLDGLDDSDLTNISVAGSGHLSAGNGVLSGNLDLTTGLKSKLSYIDGTIDLNGNDLYISGLSGNGTITDSTAFDLTDATASRVSTTSTFLSTGPATAAFANYAAFNASGQRVIARLDNATLPVCIDYNFGEPTLINAYRVFGNSEKTNKGVYSAPQRQPKSFSFWGSVDGTDWVKLDERKNETAWRFGEMRQYEFANTTAYTRYRIAFYECNGPDASSGESYVDFFKLEYGNIGAAGQLHVVVPLNNTVDNTSVVLSGNLRLMKEGNGAFVATKGSQSYSCGTEVVTGALKCGIGGDSKPFGADGNNIVVHSGAVMEMNGKKNFYNYGFTLDGGTLRNWGGDVSSDPQLKRIWLTADSTLAVTNNATIIGDDTSATTIYLNGHTLNTWISPGKYLRLYNTTILDGTVDVLRGGYLVLAGTSGVTATNVDFKATCALYVANPFSVRDYEARFYSLGSNMGAAQMTVGGVFKPTVLSYYGCTMLAGSTMDLTAWPETAGWPMASAFGTNGKTNLEFADSGEITVNLSGRDDLKALARSENPHLFTWTVADGAPVVPGAEFVLDPATAAAGFKLKKDATGLVLVPPRGMILIYK